MDINGYRPKNKLETESIIYVKQLSQNDVFEILHKARELKTKVRYGEKITTLQGKNALLLTKRNLAKFRISFDVATRSLSGNPITTPLSGSRIEEILSSDYSLRVISRYGISCCAVDTDVISDAEIISKSLKLPVINSNENASPSQSLSAVLTAWEHFGRLTGLKAVIVADFNKIHPSVLYAFSKCGVDIKIACPSENAPSDDVLNYVKQFSEVEVTSDLDSAIKNCDILYAYENDFGDDFLVTRERLDTISPIGIYLQNVTEKMTACESEVIEDKKSQVFTQGENAMHVLRASLSLIAK